jgi:hypothetical protein
MQTITVNLYKASGKWYGQFEFETEGFPFLYEVQNECLKHYTDIQFNFHVTDGETSRLYITLNHAE